MQNIAKIEKEENLKNWRNSDSQWAHVAREHYVDGMVML